MTRRLTMLTVGVIGGALIWAGAACLEDGVTALAPAHTLCRTDGIYHECNPPTTGAPFISPTTTAPPCVRYVGPVDEPDGAQFEAFSAAHGGGLDYRGDGTWADATGRVIGYATAEDSTIWNTATCAATEGAHR